MSTDVLEHIPHEEIDEVLRNLVALTDKVGYHYICSSPAQLVLPDGRNAHLIQEDSTCWAKRFKAAGAKVIEATDNFKSSASSTLYAAITFTKD